MVKRVETYGKAMWKTPFNRSEIETLLTKAYKVHDAPFNEAAAAVWGTENFPNGIPSISVEECELALQQKSGDFQALA